MLQEIFKFYNYRILKYIEVPTLKDNFIFFRKVYGRTFVKIWIRLNGKIKSLGT